MKRTKMKARMLICGNCRKQYDANKPHSCGTEAAKMKAVNAWAIVHEYTGYPCKCGQAAYRIYPRRKDAMAISSGPSCRIVRIEIREVAKKGK